MSHILGKVRRIVFIWETSNYHFLGVLLQVLATQSRRQRRIVQKVSQFLLILFSLFFCPYFP